MNAHPTLLDDFALHTRKLLDEVGAERFALPGCPESGEAVGGYEITRAICFDDQRGFAIASHPEAGFVCWQFKVENGAREYFWGRYSPDAQDAANSYVARVAAHLSDRMKEVQPQRSPKNNDKGAR
jgi:hypothetical protein